MPPGERARRRASGFTYIGLLALVLLIGVLLAAAGEVASTAAQRERETQLLWVGHEYRAAIGRYFGHRRAYPQTLQELLGGAPDAPVPVRYLRQLYPDPMTNAVDWVLVPAPRGGIMGVASSSKRSPLKTGRFDDADQGFEAATSYADWAFTFSPGALRAAPGVGTPGAGTGPGTPRVTTPGPGTPPAGTPRVVAPMGRPRRP
jgi:type II secretory pathway pseudopilin PulG